MVEVKLQGIAEEQAALRKVLESLTAEDPSKNGFGMKGSQISAQMLGATWSSDEPMNVIVPKGPEGLQ